jgi:signal transduction histidine kinase
MLEIDFLKYKSFLKIKREKDGTTFIYDPIRRKYLVLQPEELVRQLVLHYLNIEKKYSFKQMRTEKGLIINELVTNSFKYAYQMGQKPLLQVALSLENEVTLSVRDNGANFKKEDWERTSMSFGKQLVHSLTRQINGQLSLNTDLGTHFSIRFPKVA